MAVGRGDDDKLGLVWLEKLKCMIHFPAYSHHLVNWLQCPSGSPCLQVTHSDARSQCLYPWSMCSLGTVYWSGYIPPWFKYLMHVPLCKKQ